MVITGIETAREVIKMISNVDTQRFLTLFKGKNNSYVRNELPKEAPKAGEKIKTKITQNEGKVDKELLDHHLSGDFGVGLCPINTEGKCFFAVLDIDCYDKRIYKILQFIQEYNLPLLPFRSKSGGLHVYIFFAKAITARSARDILKSISYYFCLEDIYGKGKVEIFPKQDSVKENGFGSCVTLPYFNAENPYTYLLDSDGNKVEFKEAMEFIQKHFASLENIKEALENLPFSDAPPCIQRQLIAGLIGSDDSGRNNFLFSFAIYAKKKYGTGFEPYVKEINDGFECPLEDNIVDQICNSVSNNEYYYRCKEVPCSSFCDKVVCKKREFGLGRDKSHFTGVEYGELRRYLTAEPYYEWLLRLHGQEQWKKVIFRSEGDLLDQKNFQKACVRYLNNAPMQVSNNDWYTILNSVLPNIVDITVKAETDTSGISLIRNAFVSYLSNKQARRDSPYQIKVGLCVRQTVEGKAKYYFTHRGFTDYLRNQKISFDYNMLRETLKQFGAVEDTLQYTNSFGEEMHFPCWSKAEDADINEAYVGAMEIENGDKASLSAVSVSEASNTEKVEKKEEEKPYSDKDLEEAENMF